MWRRRVIRMRGSDEPMEADESFHRDLFSSVKLAPKIGHGDLKIRYGTLLVQREHLDALDELRPSIGLNRQRVDILRTDRLRAM